MEKKYGVWIMVLLANASMVFALSGWLLTSGCPFNSESEIVIVIGIFLLLSAIPVLISQSDNKWKNRLGYGIPILILLPEIYFIWDYFTCTGKFCGLDSFVFFIIFGLSAIIFALFYTLGINYRKWNVGILFFMCIELILLIVSISYFGEKISRPFIGLF